MKRVALYARVSSGPQERSLDAQMFELRTFASRQGFEVVEEVSDLAEKRSDPDRPGLDRLRDLAASGAIAEVWSVEYERYGEGDVPTLLAIQLGAHGVRCRWPGDGGEGLGGEIMRAVVGVLSREEQRKRVERSLRGKHRKLREGKLMRGPRPPYGFDYTDDGGGLVVSEPQMGIVRRLFEMLGAEGLTMGEVQRLFNRDGVPSPRANDLYQKSSGLWHKPTIRGLVLNDLYRPLSVEEVVASGMVSSAVAQALDPEGVYGLWTWGKRHQHMWRERGEDGASRDRYEMVPRLKEEWVAVPIPLSDAGLLRAHVDAARQRVYANTRRPPSTAASRFWQLSGGIVRCGKCGSVLGPKARPRPSGKIDGWYYCRHPYNAGPRECTHRRMYRADVLEETVWTAVHSILADPQRLLNQFKAHLRRQRRSMGGDPNREVRDVAARLHKLDQKESYLLDIAAETSMPKERLRAKLAELEEQRGDLRMTLREAEGRQAALRRPEENLANLHFVMLQMDRMKLNQSSPQDRHRLYQALQLQATVDREGKIRLTGIFDPDVYLPDLLKDPPADPSLPRPKIPKGTRVHVTTPCLPCSSRALTPDTHRSSG